MIIFIAGIHGVGKGTVCREVESQTEFKHFSASQLIKWNNILKNKSKSVDNISTTQELLINALNIKRKIYPKILLDGHFVLLNELSKPTPIGLDVFQAISPDVIVCLELLIETIINRLFKRDGLIYSYETLEQMQNLELECAATCADVLKVPYIRAESTQHLFDSHSNKTT